MRTTIELPGALLEAAKVRAAVSGISRRQFFIEAVELKLSPPPRKLRRRPPVVGRAGGPRIDLLTPEQVDEAMFGRRKRLAWLALLVRRQRTSPIRLAMVLFRFSWKWRRRSPIKVQGENA